MSHNFWSRMKSSTTKIQGLVSQKEHDGDSEDSTLIHKALVKFYDEKNLPYPDWLEQQPKQQPKQQRSKSYMEPHGQHERNTESFQRMSFDSGRANPIQNITSAPISQRQQADPRRPGFGVSTNSFKDIYGSNGGDSANSKAAQGDRMKERLRRNNYRNNFTG